MLSPKEQKFFNEIVLTPYIKKGVELLNGYIGRGGNKLLSAFDEIYRILNESKPFVSELLAHRKLKGEIKDEKQAMKSIAGNAFSLLICYVFLLNKQAGNIRSNIFITSRKKEVPEFDKISVIDVGGETQKPDCDLVIYSLNEDASLKNCLILSLKTSLRERAGQTYKWKLLMEIAESENSVKQKYGIHYEPPVIPKVCFATVNFYNEINNPQHRGMFKFFDQSFIARTIDADFIARLSTLPDFVNKNL